MVSVFGNLVQVKKESEVTKKISVLGLCARDLCTCNILYLLNLCPV